MSRKFGIDLRTPKEKFLDFVENTNIFIIGAIVLLIIAAIITLIYAFYLGKPLSFWTLLFLIIVFVLGFIAKKSFKKLRKY